MCGLVTPVHRAALMRCGEPPTFFTQAEDDHVTEVRACDGVEAAEAAAVPYGWVMLKKDFLTRSPCTSQMTTCPW